MTPSAVLLFAAGLGTRMAPLTNTRPKPLVEVAEKTLLDHAIDQCDGLRIVVNVHYFADQIEAHVRGRGIEVSDETDLLRETGGGLKHALPRLASNPVFTMNTDAVWQGPNVTAPLVQAWRADMEALLLLIPRDAAISHDGSGRFFDIGADGKLTLGSRYVYTGVQIIRTDGLATVTKSAFSMWELWDGMLERGTMYGVLYEGQWCDVGQPDSIAIAEAMLRGELDV